MEGDEAVATGIPARLTRREGRRFGATVGAAFLALGGLLWWRGRVTTAIAFSALGGLLALAGLGIPARLGPVYRVWMGLARVLSKVTTPVFMGIVYFVVLTTTGGLMRLFGRNPLRRKVTGGGAWVRRPPGQRRSNMEHQF
jgi:hypothetical protein